MLNSIFTTLISLIVFTCVTAVFVMQVIECIDLSVFSVLPI